MKSLFAFGILAFIITGIIFIIHIGNQKSNYIRTAIESAKYEGFNLKNLKVKECSTFLSDTECHVVGYIEYDNKPLLKNIDLKLNFISSAFVFKINEYSDFKIFINSKFELENVFILENVVLKDFSVKSREWDRNRDFIINYLSNNSLSITLDKVKKDIKAAISIGNRNYLAEIKATVTEDDFNDPKNINIKVKIDENIKDALYAIYSLNFLNYPAINNYAFENESLNRLDRPSFNYELGKISAEMAKEQEPFQLAWLLLDNILLNKADEIRIFTNEDDTKMFQEICKNNVCEKILYGVKE